VIVILGPAGFAGSEERYAGTSSERLGELGLARPGWPDEQHVDARLAVSRGPTQPPRGHVRGWMDMCEIRPEQRRFHARAKQALNPCLGGVERAAHQPRNARQRVRELDVQLRLSAAHAAHTSQAHTVREVGNSEHCPARAELIESLAGVSLVHALSL
jgi:hypothetical protein